MLWALLIILCAAVILKKLWHKLDTLENYNNPERSDMESVSEGASSKYGWGLPSTQHKSVEKSSAPVWRGTGVVETPLPRSPTCREVTDFDCRDLGKCPITLHPDITNYVLKSSIPPCPNMNDFVLKSEMPPNVDLDRYILKSEIPPCPKPKNLNDYIKKNEIPSCPPKVKCPVCPICPRCPSDGDDNSTDMSKYMLKSECRRLLREQAKGNRNALRISEKESRNIEDDSQYNGDDSGSGSGDGSGDGNDGGDGSDGYSGGMFNTMMNDIKGLFGNGASVSSSGSYNTTGNYSGLTTQGLAVGEVYKKA